jgi:hypothetical protein
MRQYEGDAPYILLPRTLGSAGVIEDPLDNGFSKGDRVIALIGGWDEALMEAMPNTHYFR